MLDESPQLHLDFKFFSIQEIKLLMHHLTWNLNMSIIILYGFKHLRRIWKQFCMHTYSLDFNTVYEFWALFDHSETSKGSLWFLPVFGIITQEQELETDLMSDHRNDPHQLLQAWPSASLYSAWGTRSYNPDISHSLFKSTNTSIFRLTVLNMGCIPFQAISLQHLKTDNLTILPASYETPLHCWKRQI